MISVFGITITPKTEKRLSQELKERITTGQKTSISTVNPEILLRAKKDKSFSSTLNSCTYRVVDGFGLALVIWIKFKKRIQRLVGRKVVEILFSLAWQEKLIVGIIGGRKKVAQQATEAFQKKYPELSVVDLSSGEDIVVNDFGYISKGGDIVEKNLVRLKPNIVLAGFGAPKQERFMLSLLQQYSSVQIVCGVGGILDVVGKKIRPVPLWFSRLGLEWLWRLIQEPKRFTRILRAVIVFPVHALFLDNTEYEK